MKRRRRKESRDRTVWKGTVKVPIMREVGGRKRSTVKKKIWMIMALMKKEEITGMTEGTEMNDGEETRMTKLEMKAENPKRNLEVTKRNLSAQIMTVVVTSMIELLTYQYLGFFMFHKNWIIC